MGFGKKHYTQARIDTILNILKVKHGIEVKRRWIFRILKDMEEEGLIKRKKRFENREDGKIYELPSIFSFTIQGAKQLYRLGVRGAKRLLDSLFSWFSRRDRRFPEPEEDWNGKEFISGEEAKKLISKFLNQIG